MYMRWRSGVTWWRQTLRVQLGLWQWPRGCLGGLRGNNVVRGGRCCSIFIWISQVIRRINGNGSRCDWGSINIGLWSNRWECYMWVRRMWQGLRGCDYTRRVRRWRSWWLKQSRWCKIRTWWWGRNHTWLVWSCGSVRCRGMGCWWYEMTKVIWWLRKEARRSSWDWYKARRRSWDAVSGTTGCRLLEGRTCATLIWGVVLWSRVIWKVANTVMCMSSIVGNWTWVWIWSSWPRVISPRWLL